MPSIPKTNLPVILVDQTIEYLVYQHYTNETAAWFLRPLLQIDVQKMKHSERFYWRQADQVVAVSDADKKEMQKVEPGLDVKIVPNGVNLDFFRKKTSWNKKVQSILFISNFKWLQNVEAARILIQQVFPLVKEVLPMVQLWIVGQHIPADIVALNNKQIIVKSIPEDDTETLIKSWHDASVFASTIKGPGGTRLKNLGAMASQLPIVSTKVGVEGLKVKNGEHVLIGDTPTEIANLIIKVIKSPKLAEKLSKTARRHVEDHFDYKSITEKLDSIYQSVYKR
jgi:glycosyltransferase involved in cell wall biosynthesis